MQFDKVLLTLNQSSAHNDMAQQGTQKEKCIYPFTVQPNKSWYKITFFKQRRQSATTLCLSNGQHWLLSSLSQRIQQVYASFPVKPFYIATEFESCTGEVTSARNDEDYSMEMQS